MSKVTLLEFPSCKKSDFEFQTTDDLLKLTTEFKKNKIIAYNCSSCGDIHYCPNQKWIMQLPSADYDAFNNSVVFAPGTKDGFYLRRARFDNDGNINYFNEFEIRRVI